MSKPQFYYCQVCGNIIEKVSDSGNDLECCMRTMVALEPGITDGSHEFHFPICKVHDKVATVTVGENDHPMEKDHYIEWIEIVTDRGVARKYLEPGMAPTVHFTLCDDERICAVYAYCNRHKLWAAKCN